MVTWTDDSKVGSGIVGSGEDFKLYDEVGYEIIFLYHLVVSPIDAPLLDGWLISFHKVG